MHLKYLHYFGNESNESLLEAYGIVASGQQIDQLRPKQCPNCSEPNKPDSKFCNKCRMVLSYDAYADSKNELEEMRKIKNTEEVNSDAISILSDQVTKLIGEIETLKGQQQ
jgi:predicted nucleic acid-binding Zn ribbon protein